VSEPALSVVIASVNGFPYLGRCLDSLRDHASEAEVVVADCTTEETRRRVSKGWPNVRLLSFDEPTPIPVLRAAGIFAAAAPSVAVIEDHCVVADGWATGLLDAQAEGRSICGGPIRNRADARLRDWAAFLFEYSAFIAPVARGSVPYLARMYGCYDSRAVATL